MIYWAQLLHFYQPPTQFHFVLDKICNESYRPLIQILSRYPHARLTVNINASLTEMLHEHGYHDVIEGLKGLARRKQIEFSGSGKYHPILPLIPEEEMARQIDLNYRTNRSLLGEAFAPLGFFPPEMCYSRDVLRPVIQSGHRWIILSGVACPGEWPLDIIHEIAYHDERIAVFFRDDILSNKISFHSITSKGFLEHMQQLGGERDNIYVVTAMDAETYGHHIQHWERLFLGEVYEALAPPEEGYRDIEQEMVLSEQYRGLLDSAEMTEQVQMVGMSELLQLFRRREYVEPKASSWSTSADDMKADNPYPLWADRENEVHQLQWEHLNICLDMVKQARTWAKGETSKRHADIARGLLDQALHSDQFWWASKRPMRDINLVYKGLLEQCETLLNAYKAIQSSQVADVSKREYYYRVLAARDLSNKIVDRLFLERT